MKVKSRIIAFVLAFILCFTSIPDYAFAAENELTTESSNIEDKSLTEKQTEKVTEKSTEKVTEKPAEKETERSTDEKTENQNKKPAAEVKPGNNSEMKPYKDLHAKSKSEEETESETESLDVPEVVDYGADPYSVYAEGSGLSRMARTDTYRVVSYDDYILNMLFPQSIPTSNPVFSPGTRLRYLRINANDVAPDGMDKKAAYCMKSILEDPSGMVTPSTSMTVSRRHAYILYNGVRRMGVPAANEAYRMDNWTQDYYVTAYAIHLTNMDIGNETPISHSTIESYVNGSSAVSGARDTWKMILKLYNDAKNATGFVNGSGEIKVPSYTLASAEEVNQWIDMGDGNWRSARFIVETSDKYAISERSAKVVNADTGASVSGASVVYSTDEMNSNFYIRLTNAAYQQLKRTGIKLKVTSTVKVHSLVGKTFVPAVSSKQPVISMMWGNQDDTKTITAYAILDQEQGSVTVTKKDQYTGTVLTGADFTLYQKVNGSYKEIKKLEFNGQRGFYQATELVPGDYKVSETKAPSGYVNETNPWSREFKVDPGSPNNNFSYDVTNKKMESKISISKLANKTKGVKLVDGRYQGTKDPGWYDFGEQVTYRMIVKNTGNVAVKNLKVVDTMTTDLKNAVNDPEAQFIIPPGLKTDKGAAVTISKDSNTQLTINRLAVGDSVTFNFVVTIKEGNIPVLERLNNIVKVTGQYENGSDTGNIVTDADDEDNDWINIADPKVSISKLANKTSGVTLVDGRYQGEKDPGWYNFGEEVRYTMIVRNYGNVKVKDLKIADTMEEDLLHAVEAVDAKFVVPEDVETELGKEVVITPDPENNMQLTIDQLAKGDSVTFEFVVKIKEKDIPVLEKLKNVVKVTGDYETPDGTTTIPWDEDDEDEDEFHVADPKLSISKLANKTTGVTLVDGRYQGTKEPGWYDFCEQVTYKIVVRNYGNAAALNLKVLDSMTEDLKNAVEAVNARFVIPEGVKTELGNDIEIINDSNSELKMDKLANGDSVTFEYVVTIKKEDVPVLEKLDNVVTVTGEYKLPEEPEQKIPEDEDDKDNDKINIADPKISISKLADKTTGVTLADGRYQGEKEPGIYYAGEQVTYKMIVRNYGNVTGSNLKVTDTMSNELKQAVEGASAKFVVPEGLKTELQNDVKITVSSDTEATIDTLAPGDSVTFEFIVTLKKEDLPALEKLENAVYVTGEYKTPGNPDKEIPQDEDDSDQDIINIFYGYVELIKTAAGSNKKLEGAEFTLYNSKNKKIATLKTDRKGYAKSEALYETNYYLKESKAPQGYRKSDKVYRFKVKKSGEIVKLEMKNDPIEVKKDVPKSTRGAVKTGDYTNSALYLVLLAGALCCIVALRHRKRCREIK